MIFKFRIRIGTFLRLNVIFLSSSIFYDKRNLRRRAFCHDRGSLGGVRTKGGAVAEWYNALQCRSLVRSLVSTTHLGKNVVIASFYSCRVIANHLEMLSIGIAIPFALDNKYLVEFDSKLHTQICRDSKPMVGVY